MTLNINPRKKRANARGGYRYSTEGREMEESGAGLPANRCELVGMLLRRDVTRKLVVMEIPSTTLPFER